MNERDIELAKQAGFDPFDIEFFQSIGKWSDIIRANEREACAKVCESRATPGTGSVAILNGAADAIRARGKA